MKNAEHIRFEPVRANRDEEKPSSRARIPPFCSFQLLDTVFRAKKGIST